MAIAPPGRTVERCLAPTYWYAVCVALPGTVGKARTKPAHAVPFGSPPRFFAVPPVIAWPAAASVCQTPHTFDCLAAPEPTLSCAVIVHGSDRTHSAKAPRGRSCATQYPIPASLVVGVMAVSGMSTPLPVAARTTGRPLTSRSAARVTVWSPCEVNANVWLVAAPATRPSITIVREPTESVPNSVQPG